MMPGIITWRSTTDSVIFHSGMPRIHNCTQASHFQKALHNERKSLPTVFGPYIPTFVPWTDVWLKWKFKYPKDFIDALGDVLRDSDLHITVVQMDERFVENLWQLCQWQNKKHITVLSASSYGHVSIPFLKQPEPVLRPEILPGERQHVVSYVRSAGEMAGSTREKILELLLPRR